MKSNGTLFGKNGLTSKSHMLEEYEMLCMSDFHDLETYTAEELDWLLHIHNRYLQFYQEERRMHFFALALIGTLMILLLPAVLTLEKYTLPLALTEFFLLVLLVPYIFVYRRYEEGVRKKMRQAIILENKIRLHYEKKNKTKRKQS